MCTLMLEVEDDDSNFKEDEDEDEDEEEEEEGKGERGVLEFFLQINVWVRIKPREIELEQNGHCCNDEGEDVATFEAVVKVEDEGEKNDEIFPFGFLLFSICVGKVVLFLLLMPSPYLAGTGDRLVNFQSKYTDTER